MIEVRVPDEQEGTKAVVRSWLRRVGDLVFENEPLVELETDKVTQEVPSPAAGVLIEILLDTDDEAEPGALLAKIDPAGEGIAQVDQIAETPAAPIAAVATAPVLDRELRLSPSVKRALLQHDIDPSRIEGTGAKVVHLATLKPIDVAAVRRIARDATGIVVAEEHHLRGGLGALVAQEVAGSRPIPIEFVAVDDRFVSGSEVADLRTAVGLRAANIVTAVKRLRERTR